MESHVFTKRSGTTDRGHDFEYYFIANLLLKLIIDDNVKDFLLSSDDENYGSFDDVVVEIIYRSGHRQIYAVQLKHLEERNLTVAALESNKGKFSIRSYFKNFNFQNDYTSIILYTNASLQATNGQVLNLENFEKTNIWKTSLESVLTTSENGEFYYLGTENSTDFRNFCKHFSLYTNQANVTQLEKQTRNSFEKLFGCKESAFTEYVNFVIKWCKIKGKKEKLNKEWIRSVIAVCILKPFVQPLSFSSEVNENMKILREGITLFQTTVFNSGCCEKVRELWSDFKQELTDVKRINMKYSVTSDFIESVDDLDGRDKETSILLWLLDKCPLILAEAPEVYRAIEVFKEKKFIIFNPKMRLQSNSVFEKLSDLENYSRIYRNILNKFTCSLQGKEGVTLKNFFDGCQGVGRILTTSELLQMVGCPIVIGGGMEVLPACHVPRRISKNIANTECLVQLKNDALIVIDNFPYTSNLKKDGEFYVTTIKDFLKTECNKENEVYLCQGKCPRADVEELCRKTNKVNYYHFCYLSETLLEYISSSNIDEIKCFIKKENFDRECELYQNDNDINIICANPGMGKSTLMKNVKNNISPTLWTLLIYTRNYSSYFRKKKTNIDDFLNHCLIETQNISTFDQNVIRFLMYQKRIVILWDGLDEMVEENLEIVKKLIHDAKVQGYQQWITSRNHLKSTLEDEFNTLSRSLEEFDEKEQKMYIGERLNLDGEEVDDIFTKIQKNIALFPNNNILGIPLQSFMLTELFLQDKEKYLNLLNEIFSLADLYEHFVDEKFNVYYREKQNLIEINEVLRERNEQDKKLMVNSYEVAAIRTYFDKKIISDSQNLKLKKDPVGFITKTTDDALSEFCHNSFGEYFAALFLTKNHNNFSVAFDLLFDPKYDNIRFFYDLMLAEGCRGHIAVLYRNYQMLTTCTEAELRSTDQLGRTTLEVACLWRKKFPLLSVTGDTSANFPYNEKILSDNQTNLMNFKYICEMLELDNEFSLENPNEIINFQKIISFLVNFLKLEKHSYDLFLTSHLVLPFVSLKKEDVTRCFEMGINHIVSVLLYAVALDFDAIFDLFEDIPFFYYREGHWCCHTTNNFLTLGVKFRSINCLRKLVFHKPHKNYLSKNPYSLYNILNMFQSNSLSEMMIDVMRDVNINTSSSFENDTLLHCACNDNNYEITKFLLENGASVNLANNFGGLPLHIACRNGNYDIAKLLVDNGSKFTEADGSGVGPLKRAVEANSEKVVGYLLQIGAPVDELHAGKTCLHEACSEGFFAIAKLLIEYNAKVNIVDGWGQMPIHYAAVSGNSQLLTLLVENGAIVNVKGKGGNTPLHFACKSYELTKILIDNEADLSALNKSKKSASHSTSDSKVLNLLIETGASLDVRDTKNRMLIHYACSRTDDYSSDFMDLLIKNTSDVNVVDKRGLAPLHYICSNHVDTDLTKKLLMLISKNASVDIIDKRGRYPVHYACLNSKNVLETLLDNGATINVCDNVKRKPLHYVFSKSNQDNFETINFLIENTFDINAPDNFGKTPLHYACSNKLFLDSNYENKLIAVVEKLISAGTNINLQDQSGKTPLHYACSLRKNSSSRLVEVLLENGSLVNRTDNYGKTPLHYACASKKNFDEIALILIKNGAIVNMTDDNNKLPLHYACISRQFPVVELLVHHRSIINFLDRSNMTPLHYAYRKHSSVVNLLLESGAKIDLRDGGGKMPIHYACIFGRFEDVKLYLEKGIDVNILDKKRKSPLHYACKSSRLNIVKLLVTNEANVNIKDVNGKTPLFYAELEVSRFLIENTPADVNVVDKDGLTLLHHSASHGDYHYVKLLIENRAKIDIADKAGRLPIHLVRSRGVNFDEMVKLLTDEKCTVDVLDDEDKTPAHYACQGSNWDLLRFLIQVEANLEVADKNGRLPIHFACNNKSYDCHRIVEILISKGVAFEIPDHNGQFPIHYACRNTYGHDVIRVLTQAGARIDVVDHDGRSPLHHACISGLKRSVTSLIKLGALVNTVDTFKRTPLHYSSAYGHVEITEILLENGSSVNFSDMDEKLPIHYACLRVHREISKFPNSSGFSFEEISSYHFCRSCRQEAEEMANKHELQIKTYHFCERNCYKTVELLLKYKSGIDVVDNKGKMPADYSREYCPKVVKGLMNRKI